MTIISEHTINIVYQTAKDICRVKRITKPKKAQVRAVMQAILLVSSAIDKLSGVSK